MQLHRLWLVFAQAVTVAVALVFVVATFQPDWLPSRPAALQPAPPAPQFPAPRSAAGEGRGDSYYEAVRRATPSVVNVFTSKEVRAPRNPLLDDPLFRRFFGDQFPDETQRATSLGSGVIISANGYILTNNHVVEAADEIEVLLPDGTKLRARAVGNDPETDLAVLRVNADKLPAIGLGSSDTLRVGDIVLAIGNPFGVGQTVTSGIVSALGRAGLGINTFENFIQTDAAINPGNSGGALIDTRGRLIGINTAIYSRSGGSMGIGFAIPVSTAKMVMDQLIKTGSVTRGWVGVEMQEITPAIAESFGLENTQGVIIAGVPRGGPADKAGVKPGDVLLEIEGKPVADPQSMLNLVASLAPGSTATMKIRRQGRIMEVKVIVGRRPKPRPSRE
jgi:serine protease DegQ